LQQAHAEALLQGAQVIAHHGRGHLTLLGGGGHAAGFPPYVNAHRLEQVHYQALL
jgi:hypothetical protein